MLIDLIESISKQKSMKKLMEFHIKWDKSPKKIWVNDMYFNSKKATWKWRILTPSARAYKNYVRQEIQQKMIRDWIKKLDNDVRVFYEIDLKYWLNSLDEWVMTRWKNKLEKNLSIRDLDWMIKLPQDTMSKMIFEDDDQVLSFDASPIHFFLWEWFELDIYVYEFNLEDYWRWRKARHEKNKRIKEEEVN